MKNLSLVFRSLALPVLLLTLNAAGAQEKQPLRYVDAATLTVIGKSMPTPKLFQRVDTARYELWQPVKNYSAFSTGLAVVFRTDSRTIRARWKTGGYGLGHNMTAIARKGLDLYIERDGQWVYAGFGWPKGDNHDSALVEYMDQGEKTCLLYLPLWDEVLSLELGVDGDSRIEAVPNPTVVVQTPETGNIELSTGLTGTVEPADQVYIIPKGSGEVLEVYVNQGDTVQKGQKLFRIDNKQLDAARITLNTTQVSLNDAQTSVNRMKALYESGDISAQAYEPAVSGLSMAKLQYDSAKLNYDTQSENTVVTAPIAGVLEQFGVQVHDMSAGGSVAGVVSGADGKTLTFNVSERVMKGLNIGDPVTVEKTGPDYSGAISERGSMVDASTGLFKVKATLGDADGLASGTMVKVYVTAEKADNVMVVPADCVNYSNGDAYVYTYDAATATAKKTPVEDGLIDSDKIQIVSGLSYDDKVITSWSKELYDGAAVNIQGSDDSAETTADSSETTAEETTEAAETAAK